MKIHRVNNRSIAGSLFGWGGITTDFEGTIAELEALDKFLMVDDLSELSFHQLKYKKKTGVRK